MARLSGHEEKTIAIKEKISVELGTLPPIFKIYSVYLGSCQKSDTTVYAYLTTLTACFRIINKDYCISEDFYKMISEKELDGYFNTRVDIGVKTLQRHWSVLNSFFSFLVEKGYLMINPMNQVSRPSDNDTKRKLSFLSKDELDRLFSAIRQSPTKFTAFRDEIIIKLAISTGLDIGDLANLNYDHIDFDERTIRIINKKGEHLIPLSDSMQILLRKWNEFRIQYFNGSDTPALFVSTKKHRLSVDAINEMLGKYCESADIHRVTFKDLKSTMVYLLARQNVSMEAIMSYLGVSDYLMIVQAYDAAMKERNVDIRKQINHLFDASSPSRNTPHNDDGFSIQVIPPEYMTYRGGERGFTVYVNISNHIEVPIRLRLISCSMYTNGMLRGSDYAYSGYQFTEDFIFPRTTKTFGKIWITDNFEIKELQTGEYMMLSIEDMESRNQYHIKFVYKQNQQGGYWVEDGHYKVTPIA